MQGFDFDRTHSHGGDAARRNAEDAEDAEAAENRNPLLGSGPTRLRGTLISRPGEIEGRGSMARSARFCGFWCVRKSHPVS